MLKEGGSSLIGVLALQGAFQKHMECLSALGAKVMPVRTLDELSICDALVLPGGESTAHHHLMDATFFEELRLFCLEKPVLATCCGLILLAKRLKEDSLPTLQILDVLVARNAYGPQKASFKTQMTACLDQKEETLTACFIRAPQILEVGPEVKVLATYNQQAVLVEQGMVLAATFHPEVVKDLTLHRYFLKQLSRRSLVDSHRLG